MQPLLVLFTTIHQTNSVSMTFSQLVADSFGKMYSRCAKICTLSLKICTPLVDSQSLFHNKRTAILFKKLFLWILYYMLHMHNFICQPYDISYYYYFYLMNEKPGSKYLSWALNFQLLLFFFTPFLQLTCHAISKPQTLVYTNAPPKNMQSIP